MAQAMAKTKRSSVKVIDILVDHDALTTTQIHDLLNNTKTKYGIRNGCTMARLNNILSKNPVFVKVLDKSNHNLWCIDMHLLENDPGLADYTVNSFLRHGPK